MGKRKEKDTEEEQESSEEKDKEEKRSSKKAKEKEPEDGEAFDLYEEFKKSRMDVDHVVEQVEAHGGWCAVLSGLVRSGGRRGALSEEHVLRADVRAVVQAVEAQPVEPTHFVRGLSERLHLVVQLWSQQPSAQPHLSRAVSLLVALSQSPLRTLRLPMTLALGAVGLVRPRSAVSAALVARVRDVQPEVRRAAVDSIGALLLRTSGSASSLLRPLHEALYDRHASVRLSSVLAVTALQPHRSAAFLRPLQSRVASMAGDVKADVCEAALSLCARWAAAGSLTSSESASVLHVALRDSRRAVRSAAGALLAQSMHGDLSFLAQFVHEQHVAPEDAVAALAGRAEAKAVVQWAKYDRPMRGDHARTLLAVLAAAVADQGADRQWPPSMRAPKSALIRLLRTHWADWALSYAEDREARSWLWALWPTWADPDAAVNLMAVVADKEEARTAAAAWAQASWTEDSAREEACALLQSAAEHWSSNPWALEAALRCAPLRLLPPPNPSPTLLLLNVMWLISFLYEGCASSPPFSSPSSRSFFSSYVSFISFHWFSFDEDPSVELPMDPKEEETSNGLEEKKLAHWIQTCGRMVDLLESRWERLEEEEEGNASFHEELLWVRFCLAVVAKPLGRGGGESLLEGRVQHPWIGQDTAVLAWTLLERGGGSPLLAGAALAALGDAALRKRAARLKERSLRAASPEDDRLPFWHVYADCLRRLYEDWMAADSSRKDAAEARLRNVASRLAQQFGVRPVGRLRASLVRLLDMGVRYAVAEDGARLPFLDVLDRFLAPLGPVDPPAADRLLRVLATFSVPQNSPSSDSYFGFLRRLASLSNRSDPNDSLSILQNSSVLSENESIIE